MLQLTLLLDVTEAIFFFFQKKKQLSMSPSLIDIHLLLANIFV